MSVGLPRALTGMLRPVTGFRFAMRRLHQRRWGRALELCFDGEASVTIFERVDAHLTDCPDCTAEIEILARLHASLMRIAGIRDDALAVMRLHAVASRIGS